MTSRRKTMQILPIRTMPEIIFHNYTEHQEGVIMEYLTMKKLRTYNQEQFLDLTKKFYFVMQYLGITWYDRIGIFAPNSPEWLAIDIASHLCKGITVPVHSTLISEDITLILNDANLHLIFVSVKSNVKILLESIKQLSSTPIVVMYSPSSEEGDNNAVDKDRKKEILELYDNVLFFDEVFTKAVNTYYDEEFYNSLVDVKPGDIATIIYTSGTTGEPKGVLLTHRNITSNILSVSYVLPFRKGDNLLSFLPLSHIFERMVDYTILYNGGKLSFSENPLNLKSNLKTIKPTILVGVPRLFESIYSGITDIPQKRTVTSIISKKGINNINNGKYNHLSVKLFGLAVKQGLGGKIRFMVSGGAALNSKCAQFFSAINIPLLEGYGMTEASPVISVNSLDENKIGSVGKPIPGVDVKISEDNEILVRGSNVMKGYYNRVSDTKKVLKDGWLHTGDTGALDEDGYLRIVDRKKSIFKLSCGKYIAPSKIEGIALCSQGIANAAVIGKDKKKISLLVYPDENFIKKNFNIIAPFEGIDFTDHTEIKEYFLKIKDEINKKLDTHEKIGGLFLLNEDFSIEKGEMTSTMKLRRHVIEENFKDMLDKNE